MISWQHMTMDKGWMRVRQSQQWLRERLIKPKRIGATASSRIWTYGAGNFKWEFISSSLGGSWFPGCRIQVRWGEPHVRLTPCEIGLHEQDLDVGSDHRWWYHQSSTGSPLGCGVINPRGAICSRVSGRWGRWTLEGDEASVGPSCIMVYQEDYLGGGLAGCALVAAAGRASNSLRR